MRVFTRWFSARAGLRENPIQDYDSEFRIQINTVDVASVSYEKINESTYNLIHSSVPEKFQGEGLGKILAERVFDHLISDKKKIKLTCEYLQSFYEKNRNKYDKHLRVRLKLFNMEEIDLKAKVFYYFQNKYYNLMQNACKEGIAKFKGNIAFHLYYALSLFLTNRLEEAIHDFETIHQENDVKLAVSIALTYGHKLLGVANKELFQKLDTQMREYRKNSEAIDFFYSAFVLYAFKKPEKALDYVEKSLSMQGSLEECINLKGWILLQLKKQGKHSADVLNIFESAMKQNPRNLSTILGYTECLLHRGEYNEALNAINKAVVRYSTTLLPLLQKMKIHFAMQDWDQTMETIHRINGVDSKNLETRKFHILILICKFSNYDEVQTELGKYFKMLENIEANNTELLVELSRLYSKVCNKNEMILNETTKTLESAIQINSENAELIVELGYQFLILGKTKEALRYFKSATKIDETSFDALLGLSLCEYNENKTSDQLLKQIRYLLELKESQNSDMLNMLRAKTSENSEEAIEHLINISESKLRRLKSLYYSDYYLLILDPDFTLDVIKEYVQHSSKPCEIISELLSMTIKSCPGLYEALYLSAKLLYLKGDLTSAANMLDKLLTNNNIPSEAHLLMAQIQTENSQFERASQSLEMCISSNFKIRENPVYHYITALVDKNANNYADAIKCLTTALTLVNITNIGLVEKASIYVELIDTLNIVGQAEEASKILEDATMDLQGTPEEARILLLSADNLIARKNVQGAIDLLEKIKEDEPCYKQAKIKQADVFLNYRKDKFAFLKIYEKFVEEKPVAENYVLLGDAYMKVLEPDSALECFEKALKESPNDAFLTSKMGKALVETHYFSRAVSYYKEAMKNSNDSELTLQLADLYLNLKDFENGELLLLNELENGNNSNSQDFLYLKHRSKLLSFLAQIQEKSGNLTYAIKSLKDAMDYQNRVRKRLAVEQGSVPEAEQQYLTDISMKLGEMTISLKNTEQAVNYYKEGLEVSPNNIQILVALAKLYMQSNELELCQQICTNILRIDSENESASIMMADIAFRKVDFDMATFHFVQLVSNQPTNWEALVRLIEVSRRTGDIESCNEQLKVAEKYCENPVKHPGFLYCTALYQWYVGNLNSALRNFNNARQDPEFGLNSICNMIEICLNPDDEMLGDQFLESDDIEYRDSRSMALKTADRLLKELKQKLEANGDDLIKFKLLTNFRLLATKEKYDIERALDDFIALASQNAYKENIGVTLGISTAYTLLKQGQRAKNQLKRIAKTPWTFEEAEHLERCWLLLSDYYIQSAKYDVAADLINKVIQHNKSCTKAYEYSGFICEKEQRHRDAANYYQQAWKSGGKNNPTVGFKLAYCLMKCKKYPDAIDMAQEVLKMSPDYPRVRKDILDKCMNNLRC